MARLEIDAVRPDINVAARRKITLLPALEFLLPASTAGERFGASLPSKAASASCISPVEMPRRYKTGRSASRLFVRRA
jgi:hypothetical protein